MKIRSTAVVVVLIAALLGTANVSSAATALSGATAREWSDPATWGGKLPGEGDSVTIPSGAHVVLDASPPRLGDVYVNGTLEFGDTDIRLRADNIMVHGTFRVGTKADPYTHEASITLTESDRSTNIMDMGGRVLGVMGGTLEMWGKQRVSWTQLDETAPAGARSIRLARDVDWHVGDRIAIASTDYWAHHVDEVTISDVDGRTIRFERPLSYSHFGELQHYGDRVLDERAEVALLTRNIVVKGAEDSSTDGYGGQIMIEHGATARFRGVELSNMGQLSRLRRYPIHFHLHGDATGSFIKSSAIHHSFNRCITIHGTDALLLANNTCYDHMGHGFFLEDGGETDNIFRRNLGFRTREVKKNPLLPTDKDPATFWITNPDNVFVGNHAAGSDDSGFWYALPEHPTGLSSDETNVWPRRTPLKRFKNNVAHSNADRGLNVDQGPKPNGETETAYYDPVVDPSDRESDEVVALFENFIGYKNRDRAVWLRGENHVVTGTFGDNRSAATFASSESFLRDSVVVGFSANKGTPESWEDRAPDGRELPFFWEEDTPIHGFEFYDGRVGVINTEFYDFKGDSMREAGALGYLEPDAFSIDPANFAQGVTFERSTPVHFSDPRDDMDGDLSKVFIDRDGSVTGVAGRAVVVDNPFLLDGNCRYQTAWNAHICNNRYVSFMAGSNDYEAEDVKPVTLTREDGVKQLLNGCCDDSDDAWTSVFPKQTYGVKFASTTTKGVRFVIRNAPDDYVIVKLQQSGSDFKVTRWGWPVTQAGSRSALDGGGKSAYFYDRDSQTLYVRVDGDDSYWNEIQVRPT